MKKIFYILILFAVCACEDTEIGDVKPSRAIVEAIMPAGEPVKIHISKEILFKAEASDTLYDVSGLSVLLNDGNADIQLIDEGDGIYTANELIDVSKIYSIRFEYNNEEVTASSNVPTKPEGFTSSKTEVTIVPSSGFGPPTGSSVTVDLKWTNDDLSSYLVVVQNLEADPVPISTTGFTRPAFRSEPLVADNYQIRGSQFQSYGRHAVILFKINPEYAALYEDPGDNSLTIKSPYTNVTNGLGIFTAVNSDTLYLEVKQ